MFARERPGDCIGYVVLSPIPDAVDIELSYGLSRDAWGRGLATEAARAGLDFGFRVRPALAAGDREARLRRRRARRQAYGQDLLFFRLARAGYLGQQPSREPVKRLK